MNKRELKRYQKSLRSGVSNTMKIGISTGVGSSVMGSIAGSVPGASKGLSAANSALGLANVGNLASVAMNIIPKQSSKRKKRK